MSIESSFTSHQDIWNDCYLGYVLFPNQSRETSQVALQKHLSENNQLDFYPWLNERETINIPDKGLTQISFEEFEKLFLKIIKKYA